MGIPANTNIATGSRFIDILQWTETKAPLLTVSAAIRFMQDHDWERVHSQCHVLLRQAIERICNLTDLPPNYPLDSHFYSQMGIAPLPPSNLSLLKSCLHDEYKIEVPAIQWQNWQFLLISIQGYNTQNDVDILLKALSILLPQVRSD